MEVSSHPQLLNSRSRRNPVLLVHGITDTSRKLRKIASHLRGYGWEVFDIDLTPNNGDSKLEVLAQQVADLVDRTFSPDRSIDLLGFSMGGLVTRYYLQRLGGIDSRSVRVASRSEKRLCQRVQRYISVSAPNHGTIAAQFSTKPACVQMRPNSDFIRDLNRDVDRLNQLNVTSIWTPFDLIILPPSSSQLSIGKEFSIPVLAHPLMVFDSRVLNAISDALSQPVKSPI